MSFEFADSFDFYNTPSLASGIGLPYTTVSNVGVTGAGRFGNYATNYAVSTLQWPLSGNRTAIFVNFAMMVTANGNTGSAFAAFGLQFIDGGTIQCSLVFRTDGSIALYSGAFTTSSPAGLITNSSAGLVANILNVWTHYQVKVVINNTTGSVEIRKDGSTSALWSATNVNTRNGTTNAYANTVGFYGNGNINNRVDDLFCFHGDDSTVPHDWAGDTRAVVIMPSADTAQKQLTPSSGANNYSRVQEVLADGDSSYVSGGTAGNYDLYDLADLTITPNTIFAVQTSMAFRMDDVGPHTVNMQIKSGATQVSGTTVATSSSYQWQRDVKVLDPNTSAAWTASAINALQIGPKVVS